MADRDRRQFIKQTAVLTSGTLLGPPAATQASPVGATTSMGIGPRRSLIVPGLHAYTVPMSVAAGQLLRVHVSTTAAYRLSICRLGLEADDPSSDTVLETFPETRPAPQPIYPGSYVHIERPIDAQSGLDALSLEGWIRPWSTDRWAGLLSQHDYPAACGMGLFLAPGGRAAFYVGNGAAYNQAWDLRSEKGVIEAGKWHHVVGTWDGKRQALWVDAVEVAHRPREGTAAAGPARLRLGAYGEQGIADHFLDGDLAVPAIYRQALTRKQITARYGQRGNKAAAGQEMLASWPLSEERGDRVADVSGQGRDGRIVNHATWMIGGPGFDPAVPRFGATDPADDPHRGHALRLASDDLYDCQWKASHEYRLPEDAQPGLYVARFDYQIGQQSYQYHATFVVKRSPRRKRAPILVLAATNTWRAYSGAPFCRDLPPGLHVCGTGGFPNSDGDPPAFCFYRTHAAGQGAYQLGLHMPWPTAGPYVLYGDKQKTSYSHLARADRFLHVWLERAGYDFDVISDLDLHQEPDVLLNYKAVVINGHSEYWSLEMLDGLRRYLDDHQGNVLCLSGNSLFWRVSFNRDGTIIECRKVDAPGNQMPPERRGECWHSHDGKHGGLLTECGQPGWELVGLATLGWNNPSDPTHFGPFYVEQPDHFLLQHPKPLGLKTGDPLGQAADGGLPRAGGHEVDVRLSTLESLLEQPLPGGATHPKDPPGITLLAAGRDWPKNGASFDYFMRPVRPQRPLGGELIYWERPSGGRVVNAGAIGAGWALLADAHFQGFVENVLHHFGIPGAAARAGDRSND